MALTLVTARARTKGKTPQNFTFPAVGTLTKRTITGNPEKGVEDSIVDDVSVESLVDSSFDEVAELVESQGLVPEGKTVVQTVMGFLLTGFNLASRRKASPVADVEAAEDELTPYIAKMVEAGIIDEANVGVLRRTLTMTSKLNESTRIEALEATKFYRAAVKAGVTF